MPKPPSSDPDRLPRAAGRVGSIDRGHSRALQLPFADWLRKIRHTDPGIPASLREASPTDVRQAFGSTQTRTPEPVSFWNALDAAQQRRFRSLAGERSFAAGARLMREGEQGNHVMVILRGRVEIWVSEEGREHLIAHRGPGQLVGERAILEVNVRSATVVASEMVRALVMTTEDFALFVSTHRSVLAIVQNQIDERQPPGPIRHGDGYLPQSQDGMRIHIGDGQFLDLTPGHPHPFAGENCMIIFTDVADFTSLERTDEHRRIIRQEMLKMTALSLAAIWDQCSREDRGDGLLIVVPPSIPTAQVLEYLHDSLPKALRRHNNIYGSGIQIQLRVALDVGPVTSDDLGVSGLVINNTARLLEAPALKNALAANRANLGFIVSDFVYQTAIRHGGGHGDPGAYAEVEVKVKKTSLHGWMQVVDPALPSPPSRDALLLGGMIQQSPESCSAGGAAR